jgi:hypothetical protein
LANRVRAIFENASWAKNIPKPSVPSVMTPIVHISEPIQSEHASGIAPSAQFREPKSQTAVIMDPDDPQYKSQSRLQRTSSQTNWIKDFM